MTDDGDEADRERARILFANAAAVGGFVALAVAAIAYAHAPPVHDLYNSVYPPRGRVHRPESPPLFLFGFPVMLLVGSIAARLNWFQGRRRMPDILHVPFLLLWLSIFFLGSLHRSWLVLSLYP